MHACMTVYRVEEIEGRREKAEVGSESTSSVHTTPGVAARAEVPTNSLLEQRRRRRAVDRSQPHRKQGPYTPRMTIF